MIESLLESLLKTYKLNNTFLKYIFKYTYIYVWNEKVNYQHNLILFELKVTEIQFSEWVQKPHSFIKVSFVY